VAQERRYARQSRPPLHLGEGRGYPRNARRTRHRAGAVDAVAVVGLLIVVVVRDVILGHEGAVLVGRQVPQGGVRHERRADVGGHHHYRGAGAVAGHLPLGRHRALLLALEVHRCCLLTLVVLLL